MQKFKVFIYDVDTVYVDTIVTAMNKDAAEKMARQLMINVDNKNALISITPLEEYTNAGGV